MLRTRLHTARHWIGANILAWALAVPVAAVVVSNFTAEVTTVGGDYHVYDTASWVFDDVILNWRWDLQHWAIIASWLLLWAVYALITGGVLVWMDTSQRKVQLSSDPGQQPEV